MNTTLDLADDLLARQGSGGAGEQLAEAPYRGGFDAAHAQSGHLVTFDGDFAHLLGPREFTLLKPRH